MWNLPVKRNFSSYQIMIWDTRRRTLDLSGASVVMGILNATPDSFSDGGKFSSHESALSRALEMVRQGAAIIDIGGESTRPGAEAINTEEEIKRTIPLIESLRAASDVLISIDTSKPKVAEAAIEAGADIVNDVTGLRDRDMIRLCIDATVGVCVMHMQGQPRTMQVDPNYAQYGGVVKAVASFFEERLETLVSSGMSPGAICFDPGIGFGKSFEHNIDLLKSIGQLQGEQPLLLGVSRKSFIGQLTGEQEPCRRDEATALITALAHSKGVRLHRVHDVSAALKALRVAEALEM